MMSFIESGSETRTYRISSGNKLYVMYGGLLPQHNSLTSFDGDAENFLLKFLMYVQIASTDVSMATQNWIQKVLKLKVKLKLPTKSIVRSLWASL